jgi:hypothetical protein
MIKWAVNVVHMGKIILSCNILVGKPERKRSIGKSRH